jgi:hypothetical protein
MAVEPWNLPVSPVSRLRTIMLDCDAAFQPSTLLTAEPFKTRSVDESAVPDWAATALDGTKTAADNMNSALVATARLREWPAAAAIGEVILRDTEPPSRSRRPCLRRP